MRAHGSRSRSARGEPRRQVRRGRARDRSPPIWVAQEQGEVCVANTVGLGAGAPEAPSLLVGSPVLGDEQRELAFLKSVSAGVPAARAVRDARGRHAASPKPRRRSPPRAQRRSPHRAICQPTASARQRRSEEAGRSARQAGAGSAARAGRRAVHEAHGRLGNGLVANWRARPPTSPRTALASSSRTTSRSPQRESPPRARACRACRSRSACVSSSRTRSASSTSPFAVTSVSTSVAR